jgi:hypothetical protein
MLLFHTAKGSTQLFDVLGQQALPAICKIINLADK